MTVPIVTPPTLESANPRVRSSYRPAIQFRESISPADIPAVQRIVQSTGFFSSAEVEVAVELLRERHSRGACSGYFFVFAEQAEQMLGYACFGPIACTQAGFDLYWIAVDPSFQGGGIGRALLREAERLISRMEGRRVYIETSSRPQYEPTRAFYLRCGYSQEAVLKDFYSAGDDKIIFVRSVDCAAGFDG